MTRLVASAPTENLDELLELVGQVLLHPRFPQEELDRWKAEQRSQLVQMRATPAFLGLERLRQALYGGDARAMTVRGTACWGWPGNISADAMVAKLEKEIGGWAAGRAERPDLGGRIRITSLAWR